MRFRLPGLSREDGVLRSSVGKYYVDVPTNFHPGIREQIPSLGSASADPVDPRPREGDCRLRAPRIGFGGRPFAVRLVPISLNPTGAVGDSRVVS